jgi:hypothetical protein
MVGNDQYSVGDWLEVFDAKGNPTGCVRRVVIVCDFCGVFELDQNHDLAITASRGPFHGDKNLRRLESQVPSTRFDRRVSA